VINAAHDLLRRQVGREHIADDARDGVESATASFAVDAAVRDAVRRLPDRQRDALFLRFYLGFDYAAIAEALAIEIGTVSATLHSARAALARHLQEVAR
jgi:RNA polymerase sigma factor (sigma-70 family)